MAAVMISTLDWLMINPHLIPSTLLFFLGGILLVAAPVLYRIRKSKYNVLVPANIFKYSRLERILLILGIISVVLGLGSLIVISELHGYYYFKNGVPAFLKRN